MVFYATLDKDYLPAYERDRFLDKIQSLNKHLSTFIFLQNDMSSLVLLITGLVLTAKISFSSADTYNIGKLFTTFVCYEVYRL